MEKENQTLIWIEIPIKQKKNETKERKKMFKLYTQATYQ